MGTFEGVQDTPVVFYDSDLQWLREYAYFVTAEHAAAVDAGMNNAIAKSGTVLYAHRFSLFLLKISTAKTHRIQPFQRQHSHRSCHSRQWKREPARFNRVGPYVLSVIAQNKIFDTPFIWRLYSITPPKQLLLLKIKNTAGQLRIKQHRHKN
jgi:hypothetical protein